MIDDLPPVIGCLAIHGRFLVSSPAFGRGLTWATCGMHGWLRRWAIIVIRCAIGVISNVETRGGSLLGKIPPRDFSGHYPLTGTFNGDRRFLGIMIANFLKLLYYIESLQSFEESNQLRMACCASFAGDGFSPWKRTADHPVPSRLPTGS